ncbi:IclR family transcriptional regulator [Halalkalibacterium ligniniphilum]|uniref:IclR family transcriptional regulator n=1 Tax=Halalkalibacterium ligniniphilum TaxID=1134413 RepID=UPI000345085A|nr:IclR family transcriptional regulator [Halalkalibacterium ligniniphilum]
MEIKKNGTTIQTLQVGISIIDLVAKQGKPIKFVEIHEQTKITKSNLYKYLNTFIQLGMLYRDKGTGAYTLGSKLIEYGMAAVDQENVIDRITPYLQEVNIKSQSTVLFSVWTHNGPMIVKYFNDSQGLNIGAQIGTILPINSATGKIFLTFMNEQVIKNWTERELKDLPSEKIEELERETRMIREKKITFAREPIVASVSSVAFPVLNFKGALLGTVTIVGFSEVIPTSEKDEFSQYLIEISSQISKSFGYKAVPEE